jgi:hypothetical protein
MQYNSTNSSSAPRVPRATYAPATSETTYGSVYAYFETFWSAACSVVKGDSARKDEELETLWTMTIEALSNLFQMHGKVWDDQSMDVSQISLPYIGVIDTHIPLIVAEPSTSQNLIFADTDQRRFTMDEICQQAYSQNFDITNSSISNVSSEKLNFPALLLKLDLHLFDRLGSHELTQLPNGYLGTSFISREAASSLPTAEDTSLAARSVALTGLITPGSQPASADGSVDSTKRGASQSPSGDCTTSSSKRSSESKPPERRRAKPIIPGINADDLLIAFSAFWRDASVVMRAADKDRDVAIELLWTRAKEAITSKFRDRELRWEQGNLDVSRSELIRQGDMLID